MKTYPPSQTFINFISLYPDSEAAIAWKEQGEEIPRFAAGFVHALYDGNIEAAMYLAPADDCARLQQYIEQFIVENQQSEFRHKKRLPKVKYGGKK